MLTIALIAYILYYANIKASAQSPVVTEVPKQATSTPISVSTTTPTKTITTKTGKVIHIKETNPDGESLSTITITTEGFASNTPITFERNKLTDFFLADLNKDNFDELIIITTSAGSGSNSDLDVFTTAKDAGLTKITVPQIQEEDSVKGGNFEGYMGHDSFSVTNGILSREYPIYLATDTNDNPTGGKRKLNYSLTEKNAMYTLSLAKENQPAQAATNVPQSTSTKPTTVPH